MSEDEMLEYLKSTGLYENTDVDMFYEKKMIKSNKTISIRDLVERIISIDKEFNGEPWNIRQILTNIDMVIPVENKENRKIIK